MPQVVKRHAAESIFKSQLKPMGVSKMGRSGRQLEAESSNQNNPLTLDDTRLHCHGDPIAEAGLIL